MAAVTGGRRQSREREGVAKARSLRPALTAARRALTPARALTAARTLKPTRALMPLRGACRARHLLARRGLGLQLERLRQRLTTSESGRAARRAALGPRIDSDRRGRRGGHPR